MKFKLVLQMDLVLAWMMMGGEWWVGEGFLKINANNNLSLSCS